MLDNFDIEEGAFVNKREGTQVTVRITLKNTGRAPAENVLLILELEHGTVILGAETVLHNNAKASVTNDGVVVETAEILPGLDLKLDVNVKAPPGFGWTFTPTTGDEFILEVAAPRIQISATASCQNCIEGLEYSGY